MTSTPFRIIFLGSQGAGKGTQAERLSCLLGIPAISTGALCREEASKETPMGRTIGIYLQAGRLLPSTLISCLMQERLGREDVKQGWIVDGYPRDQMQLTGLLAFTHPTHVIILELSDEESIARLAGRRVCSNCKTGYHILYMPPRIFGHCDRCDGLLVRRDDDTPEAIERRLAIYHAETEPIITLFEKMGIVFRVNGAHSVEEIGEEIAVIFDASVCHL
ncbi:MAG: Adenylate kinase [Candidatus Uhrbacteria bacterium GW2011_GWF2_41_16]|jgi:adenylate kinase|uniref:Adenylate kinase n=2 Tax=Candidatus Uhriibacteriota TaxID=1752732 RepID=A0A0G0VC45_9BACT|nr:MAG: Adenylate kinase [Candidatus Uhrbacteria bacterium GW2011_GWA2_41_10]KKR87538.1 MAG: Adenylate kinase [Candidatus Uhrbacteria bacterium GW2011_GWC2_41_11]KKR98518.1 MAG: Adenylate kinase [Candidatus Uhrbacteria bacterium GW2011_GWF2_41_16]